MKKKVVGSITRQREMSFYRVLTKTGDKGLIENTEGIPVVTEGIQVLDISRELRINELESRHELR